MQKQLSLVFVAGVLLSPESSSQSHLHTMYITPWVAIKHRVPHAGRAEFACVQEPELMQLPSCQGLVQFAVVPHHRSHVVLVCSEPVSSVPDVFLCCFFAGQTHLWWLAAAGPRRNRL